MKGLFLLRFAVLYLVFLTFVTACHRRALISDHPVMSVLVVDSEASEEIRTQTQEVKGWWFGARDIYRNPNSGDIFSDVLARLMASKVPSFDVYPRNDLRYYIANKKDRLKKSFPELSDKSIEIIFSRTSYYDFARDLDLDKVIVARLHQCATVHNRTFHFWSSVIEVEASLIDAESGESEWTRHLYSRKLFHSSYGAMEKVAAKLIRKMKKEYLKYGKVGE